MAEFKTIETQEELDNIIKSRVQSMLIILQLKKNLHKQRKK